MLRLAFMLLVLVGSTNTIFRQGEATRYFDRAASALLKAMHFMDRELENVNVDAFIGTRIVDGQLEALLKNLAQRGWTFKRPMEFHQLQKIQRLTQDVSDRGVIAIKRRDPKGVFGIEAVISKGFWNFLYKTKWINPDLITPSLYRDHEAMVEGNSDLCIAEFFGRTKFNKTQELCNITDACWVLMTSPNYSMYSLTHEVFYLEIGRRSGCLPQMKKMIKRYRQTSVDTLNAGFCANVYYEAGKIAERGFYWSKQDLFMEQAALCGIIGYRNYFKPEWLEEILSWQSQEGCYKELTLNDLPKDRWKKGNLYLSRFKREEKKVTGGCLSHKTSVASAALVEYLKYISEDMDS